MRNPYFDKNIKFLTLRRIYRIYAQPVIRDDVVNVLTLSFIKSTQDTIRSKALYSIALNAVRNEYENYRRKVIELNSNDKEL